MTRLRLPRLRGERGYTLVEMVAVMGILAAVMTGLTTLFVSGTKAEIDLNNRFQAQLNVRIALDQLRREVHCASDAPNVTTTSVTLTIPCATPTTVTWCTVPVAGTTQRFQLYRSPASTCDASGKQYADYLTSGNVFSYQDHSSASLAKLHTVLRVDLDPSDSKRAYTVCDDIVFRNTARVAGDGSTVAEC